MKWKYDDVLGKLSLLELTDWGSPCSQKQPMLKNGLTGTSIEQVIRIQELLSREARCTANIVLCWDEAEATRTIRADLLSVL